MKMMKMNRAWWMAALALCLCLGLALGADKPDFSGTWTIDGAKSDFGQMPAPQKMERVIDHKDPDIKIKTTQSTPSGEERTNETTYKIDGNEQKQETPRGTVSYTPKWDGKQLVVISKRSMNIQGQAVEINGEERWSLSDDGKTMTVDSKMSAPMGEMTMKAVFNKK